MTEPSQQGMELLVSLMSAGHQMTTGTMDSLIQSLTVEGREAKATLALVRAQLRVLVELPYVPNPSLIADAAYPSRTAVEEWLEDHYGPDWRDPAARKVRCSYGCC